MTRNNIGFGIFCFGNDYYYKGAYDKITHILDSGYECYVLTENPDYFKDISDRLNIIPYYRSYKSYHDKMILPRHILKDCQFCILIDADLEIKDYSFLDDLRHYDFKDGISYIDVLLNHPERKECVKELDLESREWNDYNRYCQTICPTFKTFKLIWEYFLVINKDGFNPDFFQHYDKLQIKKESCYFDAQKDVNAPGEGISITVSSVLSNTPIQRDLVLYDLLKDKMKSISTRFSQP
jgi:hypothetical protein